MTGCRLLLLPFVVVAFGSIGGCASGNTSSFTQAPLFFSDQVAEDGTATDVTRQTAAADAIVAGDFAAGVPTYLTVGGNAVLPVNRVAAIDVNAVVGRDTVAAGAAVNAGPLANAGLATSLQPGALAVGANVGSPALGTSLGVGAAVNGVPLVAPSTVQPGIAASLGGTNLALTAPVTLGTAPLAGTLSTVGPVLGQATAAPILQTLPNTLIQSTATTLTRTCLLRKC